MMSNFSEKEQLASVIDDGSAIMQGGEAEKAADFANYFVSYAYLYHQKQMLMDHVRMTAYHSSIMENKHLFEGKVVLDVGAGSGVLSIWAAKAGAKKVYAIEYTDMAKHAREMVKGNGLSDIVEVMQCSAEDIDLPCKVDIVISEWMGYLLLRESMLDSVIRARDKWMKPEGAMFPSQATMFFAPITYEEDRLSKNQEYQSSLSEWTRFSEEMKNYYDMDMRPLDQPYSKEQIDYFIYTGLWTELRVEHVLCAPFKTKRIDLNTCTIAEVQGMEETSFNVRVRPGCVVSGFAGWFSVDFDGSPQSRVTKSVTLSTGPEVGYTHWGQQVFYFKDPIYTDPEGMDVTLKGTVEMVRQKVNQRLYHVKLVVGKGDEAPLTQMYELP